MPRHAQQPTAPAPLVLLRHGESTANADNVFTGWTDPPLTARGQQQAHAAARLLQHAGLVPDLTHTSVLRRSIATADLVLDHLDRAWAPVQRSWRLNERHYGRLTGRRKDDVHAEVDEATYRAWRRSYTATPPPAPPGTLPPFNDPRYQLLPRDAYPLTESLADVAARVLPYWVDTIAPALRAGRTTLVVAHGNSLRALVTHLDRLTPEQVTRLNIPSAIPLVYDFDQDLRPLTPGGRYLDPVAAAREAQAVARQ